MYGSEYFSIIILLLQYFFNYACHKCMWMLYSQDKMTIIYSLQACKRKSILVQCIFTQVIYKKKKNQFLFPESSGCLQWVIPKHVNSKQCNCLVPSINRNTGSWPFCLSLPGSPRANTALYEEWNYRISKGHCHEVCTWVWNFFTETHGRCG